MAFVSTAVAPVAKSRTSSSSLKNMFNGYVEACVWKEGVLDVLHFSSTIESKHSTLLHPHSAQDYVSRHYIYQTIPRPRTQDTKLSGSY